MKVHPIADAIPMDPVHVENLVEDIKTNGLIEPLIVDRDGVLLDGRHRLEACKRAGVEPRTETCEGDPLEVVLSANLARRELTKGQRAALALEILPEYEERAKQRQREHGGTAPGRSADTEGKSAPSESGRAVDAAAARLGVSASYVKRVRKLRELDPEVFERVASGELGIVQAEDASAVFQKLRKKAEAARRKEERERLAASQARTKVTPTVDLFLERQRGREAQARVIDRHVKPGGVVLERGGYGDNLFVLAEEPRVAERNGRTVHARHEALSWRIHRDHKAAFDGPPVETVLEGYLKHPGDPFPEELLRKLIEMFCPPGGVVAEFEPSDGILERAARASGRTFKRYGQRKEVR